MQIPKMPEKLMRLEEQPKELVEKDDPWLVIAESMHTRGFGNLFCRYETGVVFSDKKKIKFLRALATSGRKGYSAQAIGLSAAVINYTIKGDPVFAAAVEEAKLYFQDLLIGEMFRRGVTGFKKEVLGGKGKDTVYEITDYSDKALDMIARVHIPAMQRKQIEVKTEAKTESNVSVVNAAQLDISNMHPDDLALFEQIMNNQARRLEDREAEQNAVEGEVT